ncbi:MAG: DoxX family protein [Algoriphagus sp.]|nr:DoxX family protein [Algoriphagus sp.]
MGIHEVLVLSSSFSFFAYGIAYFSSPKMKEEFIRFGLAKFGTLTAVLEIFGALGLVIGLTFTPLLVFSAGGLSLLMLLGVAVRLRINDPLLVIVPAFSFFILNAYLFFKALQSL